MSKLVSKNINDYLPAPSEEEIEKRLENSNLGPNGLLDISAKGGYLRGIKKALDQGADINFINDLPLRLASIDGHLNVVKYLIDQGADIHTGNDTPLRLAVREGHKEIVTYLKSKMKEENE